MALIRSAAMLVAHIGEPEAASRIEQAVERAIADPANHTGDLGGKATTVEFTDAVIAGLEA